MLIMCSCPVESGRGAMLIMFSCPVEAGRGAILIMSSCLVGADSDIVDRVFRSGPVGVLLTVPSTPEMVGILY